MKNYPLTLFSLLLLLFAAPRSLWAQATLENPQPGSVQSGISVISGWACNAARIDIEIDGTIAQAAHGTSREDTQPVCGDANNGFGLLFNWNLLSSGPHTVRALADSSEFAKVTVTVVTFGTEFLTGANGEFALDNFPQAGKQVTLLWQESLQNFVIKGASPSSGGNIGGGRRFLENPRPGSFQSGIGLISGWACGAGQIDIEIDGAKTQAAYGTSREDTRSVCGDANNGFGLLFNWNLLRDGVHMVRALADGNEFASVSFVVTTLGVEFLRGANGSYRFKDFPQAGESVIVQWQESIQNFAIEKTCSSLQPCSIPSPLRVSLSNPRYFTDADGKALYLTGSHEGWELQDNAFDAAIIFDYSGYLNFLQAHNMNFIRMWTIEITRTGRPGTSGATPLATPVPYARSSVCCALDGLNKFDLYTFNQAYFACLRQRVIDAGNRGIYVSYLFFDGFGPDDWLGHPYNVANNINNVNGDTNGNGSGYDNVHALVSPQITQLQEAYVREVIDTLNDLDNIIWQVANETGNVLWNYHFIDYIHSYESRKPKRHPVNMVERSDFANTTVQRMTQELYASNAESISPTIDKLNPAVSDGRKVVLFDTDHGAAYAADPAIPWKSFTRGNEATWIIDDSASYNNSNSSFEPIRKAAGYVRAYADKMNLITMTPRGDLTSTTYALANPGSEYLVYQPSSGQFTVNLMQGSYTYEWFDPSIGAIASTGTMTVAGGDQIFIPPFSGNAVLYLKNINTLSFDSSFSNAGNLSATQGQAGSNTIVAALKYLSYFLRGWL